jgi:hypothetical protein
MSVMGVQLRDSAVDAEYEARKSFGMFMMLNLVTSRFFFFLHPFSIGQFSARKVAAHYNNRQQFENASTISIR